MDLAQPPEEPPDLDPEDWPGTRAQAHRMLDDMLDYSQTIRDRPVWRPMPPAMRAASCASLCRRARTPGGGARRSSCATILPYATGNVHPGFMGWVHGGGTAGGHAGGDAGRRPERQPGRARPHAHRGRAPDRRAGCAELFGFPESASGLFVTGTSMANFMGVLVRAAPAPWAPRCARRGLAGGPAAGGLRLRRRPRLRAAGHGDVPGWAATRCGVLPVDRGQRIDLAALAPAIAADRAAGLRALPGGRHRRHGGRRAPSTTWRRSPSVAGDEGLWFHVDGAYGALGVLAPELAPRLAGHRARRLHRLRLPQVGPGALRRRLPAGARRRAASRHLRLAGRLSAARDPRAWPAGSPVALRFRARPVARFPRAEDLVHAQGLRHRAPGRGDRANLRPGPAPGGAGRGRAGAGAAGAGGAQHRLLPLPGRRTRTP